jgi:hypothetical protein
MTPEMLQVLSDLVQKQAVIRVPTKKPAAANGGNGKKPASLDRDQRGYGQF